MFKIIYQLKGETLYINEEYNGEMRVKLYPTLESAADDVVNLVEDNNRRSNRWMHYSPNGNDNIRRAFLKDGVVMAALDDKGVDKIYIGAKAIEDETHM